MLTINNYKNDFIGIMIMKNCQGKCINVNIYMCNGLGAYCTRQYLPNNKKEINTILWGFWNNKEHLKNCLGINKGYNDIYEKELLAIYFIKTNDKMKKAIIQEIGKYFIKRGYKTIFNDENIKECIYD